MSEGKIPIPQDRDAISIWRVYLPSDIDREQYIKKCYLSGTVSLVDEFNEVAHRVKIGKLTLQLIEFPIDVNHVGSEVICVSMPYGGRLYVIDVYSSNGDFIDQDEQQFRFIKSINGGLAEVRVDGNGKILLTVDSEEDSEIIINVANKEKAGKITVGVNGSAVVRATEQVLLDSPKILLNESEESILLGNKTVKLIGDVLTQLGKESAGPYPLLGQSIYNQLKETLEELKSKISFVK